MRSAEFFERFAHEQEIGRDITDDHLSVFYDNGREVGCWREKRSTTLGQGDVLSEGEADCAREWCKRIAGVGQGRSL